MRKLPISHFLDGTGGRIASLCRVCVASHTALDTPSTASPQHRPKRDIDNFHIPYPDISESGVKDHMLMGNHDSRHRIFWLGQAVP